MSCDVLLPKHMHACHIQDLAAAPKVQGGMLFMCVACLMQCSCPSRIAYSAQRCGPRRLLSCMMALIARHQCLPGPLHMGATPIQIVGVPSRRPDTPKAIMPSTHALQLWGAPTCLRENRSQHASRPPFSTKWKKIAD